MPTNEPLTLRGHIMDVLMPYAEPVLGFTLWETQIAERLGADPADYKSRKYRDFKQALVTLTELGYLAAVEAPNLKGRLTTAKLLYVVTEEGEHWWDHGGQEIETVGDKTDRESLPALPRKKWLSGPALPTRPQTWSKIAAAALRGEIEIAIRDTAR